MISEPIVGYLVATDQGWSAVCPDCKDKVEVAAPLYLINIKPYSQFCHVCSAVIHSTPCCELFSANINLEGNK